MVEDIEEKEFSSYDLAKIVKNAESKLKKHKTQTRRSVKATSLINDLITYRNVYESPFFKAIDIALNYNNRDAFLDPLPKGTIVYRARLVNTDNINRDNGLSIDDHGFTFGFDKDNSMEAPLGLATAGRNNIKGMSYLYVCEDEATACAEIKTIPKSLISLAEIKIIKSLEVFNFCKNKSVNLGGTGNTIDINSLFAEASMYFSRPIANEGEYALTQLISDYVRKTGIDGIAYTSFFTAKKNYTIFNSHSSNVHFLNSRLVANQGAISYYWDFNNDKSIIAGQDGLNYEENNSDDVRDILKNRLQI